MLESSTYVDSVAKGELVPQIVMNKFTNPEDEWSLWDLEEIMERQFNFWYGEGNHNAVSKSNFPK